jgi:hypothetical protein
MRIGRDPELFTPTLSRIMEDVRQSIGGSTTAFGEAGEKRWAEFFELVGFKIDGMRAVRDNVRWDVILRPDAGLSLGETAYRPPYFVECKSSHAKAGRIDRNVFATFMRNVRAAPRKSLIFLVTNQRLTSAMRQDIHEQCESSKRLVVVLGPDEASVQNRSSLPSRLFLVRLVRHLEHMRGHWSQATAEREMEVTEDPELGPQGVRRTPLVKYDTYVRKLGEWLVDTRFLFCTNQAAPYQWVNACGRAPSVRKALRGYWKLMEHLASGNAVVLRRTVLQDRRELTDPLGWMEDKYPKESLQEWMTHAHGLHIVDGPVRLRGAPRKATRKSVATSLEQAFRALHLPSAGAVYILESGADGAGVHRHEEQVFEHEGKLHHVRAIMDEDVPSHVELHIDSGSEDVGKTLRRWNGDLHRDQELGVGKVLNLLGSRFLDTIIGHL